MSLRECWSRASWCQLVGTFGLSLLVLVALGACLWGTGVVGFHKLLYLYANTPENLLLPSLQLKTECPTVFVCTDNSESLQLSSLYCSFMASRPCNQSRVNRNSNPFQPCLAFVSTDPSACYDANTVNPYDGLWWFDIEAVPGPNATFVVGVAPSSNATTTQVNQWHSAKFSDQPSSGTQLRLFQSTFNGTTFFDLELSEPYLPRHLLVTGTTYQYAYSFIQVPELLRQRSGWIPFCITFLVCIGLVIYSFYWWSICFPRSTRFVRNSYSRWSKDSCWRLLKQSMVFVGTPFVFCLGIAVAILLATVLPSATMHIRPTKLEHGTIPDHVIQIRAAVVRDQHSSVQPNIIAYVEECQLFYDNPWYRMEDVAPTSVPCNISTNATSLGWNITMSGISSNQQPWVVFRLQGFKPKEVSLSFLITAADQTHTLDSYPTLWHYPPLEGTSLYSVQPLNAQRRRYFEPLIYQAGPRLHHLPGESGQSMELVLGYLPTTNQLVNQDTSWASWGVLLGSLLIMAMMAGRVLHALFWTPPAAPNAQDGRDRLLGNGGGEGEPEERDDH